MAEDNGTSFIMPVGVDYRVNAGEVVTFHEITAGNWEFVSSSDVNQIVGMGAYANLIIENNSGTPNSQMDIDADAITLIDASDFTYQANSANLTIDITASGANGLDTGSEANSTQYYLWVIYNITTDTAAGLLSLSSTAPTMPSGYTYKRRVGATFNDSSGNLEGTQQTGNRLKIVTLRANYLTGGSLGSFTLITPNAPATVREITVNYSTAAALAADFSVDGTNSQTQLIMGAAERNDIDVPVDSNQQHYYKVSASSWSLKLIGWVDNL